MATGGARIVCGWCGETTPDVARCSSCSRDPRLAWQQRNLEPPLVDEAAATRLAYTRAVDELRDAGQATTVEAIADHLDKSPRTIRRWKAELGL